MRSLIQSLGSPFFQRAAVEALLIGALAGAVGVHVLLRRLPFFVVAMSHATFPGVVIASVLGFSIFAGGVGFGLLVVLAIVALGSVRALDDSSVIGVVLAGSFAIGVLVLSSRASASRDLSAFLVGQILTVTHADIATTLLVGLVVLAVLAGLHKELLHGAFDAAGLGALGYSTRALDLVLLVVITVTLVTSVPAVGTLLSVALLTVPALAARQWVERVVPMMVLAAAIGSGSGLFGLCISAAFDVAAGGAMALTASGVFLLSAAVRSPRSPLARRPRPVAATPAAA